MEGLTAWNLSWLDPADEYVLVADLYAETSEAMDEILDSPGGRAASARPRQLRHGAGDVPARRRGGGGARMTGLTIAVLGLGFGQDFVPIYLAHPEVERVVVVEPDAVRRADVARRFGLDAGVATLEEVLADDDVDAVHMLPPVQFHADYAVRVLEAGKHCASAVPAATTLGRPPGDHRRGTGIRPPLHDDGDLGLTAASSSPPDACSPRAGSARRRCTRACTSRTSTASRSTGRASRRCTT